MDLYKTHQEKIAKNIWNTMKLIFCITKKRITNGNIIALDLTTLLKRGKIASKAIAKLISPLSHRRRRKCYSALTCRTQDDVVSFISPREYEFSCRDTPLFASLSKKRRRQRCYYYSKNEEEDAKLMQKVLDILHRYDGGGAVEATAAGSPMLPGFGQSPTAARQLRVSDSPFLLRGAGDDGDDGEGMVGIDKCYQVDKDAEDFIDKFYRDLKNQKRVSALESQSPAAYDRIWAR